MVSAWEDAFALLEAHGDIQEARQALLERFRALQPSEYDQLSHLHAIASRLRDIVSADQPVQ